MSLLHYPNLLMQRVQARCLCCRYSHVDECPPWVNSRPFGRRTVTSAAEGKAAETTL
jgi:hypothetical protein